MFLGEPTLKPSTNSTTKGKTLSTKGTFLYTNYTTTLKTASSNGNNNVAVFSATVSSISIALVISAAIIFVYRVKKRKQNHTKNPIQIDSTGQQVSDQRENGLHQNPTVFFEI